MKNTIAISCTDLVCINRIIETKRAGKGAFLVLLTQPAVIFILLALLILVLKAYCERVTVYIDFEIFFFEAGSY